MDVDKDNIVMRNVHAVIPKSWPNGPLGLDPEYGEQNVRDLCDFFGLDWQNIKHEYRDFKEMKVMKDRGQFMRLCNAVNTMVVSDAECKRGFSEINDICTETRNRLNPKHISTLMFLSLSGPPFQIWDPTPYATRWCASRRSADYSMCPKRKEFSCDDSSYSQMWKLL